MRVLVSLFRHARDNQPDLRETDWPGLVSIIGEHRILPHNSKIDAPALCPAEWPEGERRAKDTVRRVWFGALDFDEITGAEMEEVLGHADGLACIFYTTWRHGEQIARDGLWRFRLLVALSRPVEITEWPRWWPRLFARFGGLPDPKCVDPSRIYFLPSAPSPDRCVVETQEGAPLDVDALFATADPPKPNIAREERQSVGPADLEELAGRLIRRRSPTAKVVANAIRHATKGETFAAPGVRDDTLFRVACLVAEEWPNAEPAAVASHFGRSLAFMAALDVGTSNPCPTVDDFAEKIARRQVEVREEREKREGARRDAQSSRISAAFDGERSDPYTEDELDSFAEAAGTDRAGFMRRWVVQAGSSYYVFKGGQYGPSLVREELAPTAERELAAAETAGVTVWRTGDDGEPRIKSAQELVLQYGEAAQCVVADLSAQRSKFELKGKVMIEAPCPLRDLVPGEFASLDLWLRAIGGAQAERFLNWLACVTLLGEPCAALYLDGEPGCGKTLFADALSRLWTQNGPTPMAEVVGNFNEALLGCPLVFADEVLPEALKHTEGTGTLRQLIQARQLPLRRKYRPTATIRGAVRVILAANNKNLLDTPELLTPDDTAALAERILYLRVTPQAKEALRDLGHDAVERFVTDDRLARYALWLRDNRRVVREHRFLVSGAGSDLHRSLTTARGLPSAVCHWCVSYLLEPGKMDTQGKLLVRVQGNELLVTARALSEQWDQYPTNVKAPASGRISRALAGLCSPKKRQLVAGTGKPTNYWVVKTENLLTWTEDMGYATEEEILDALLTDTPAEGGP